MSLLVYFVAHAVTQPTESEPCCI